MTEPSIRAEPVTEPTDGANIPIHPTDILLTLLINFLAPMFLGASTGDIGFARLAAMETVNAYGARNPLELVTIAQIIGFGLGALGSLSLSMADNLSLSMTLRLRGNANALNRSAELNRRALEKSRRDDAMPGHAIPEFAIAQPDPAGPATMAAPAEAPAAAADRQTLQEAAVVAAVKRTRMIAAQFQARAAGPAATPTPTDPASTPPASTPSASTQSARSPIPPNLLAPADPARVSAPTNPLPVAARPGAPTPAEQRHRAAWAAAIADVAAEFTAELPNCPPHERQANTVRAAALNSSAMALISSAGEPPPNAGVPNAA